jgi:hypothetical protein
VFKVLELAFDLDGTLVEGLAELLEYLPCCFDVVNFELEVLVLEH